MAERSIRDPNAPPLRARRSLPVDQARPLRRSRRPAEGVEAVEVADSEGQPATSRPSGDRRRLIAAFASSLIPGLGQALNGRVRVALAFAIPTLVAVALVWLFIQSDRPTMLVARLIAPSMLSALLVVNVVVLVWRAVAVLQAFMDRRYARLPGRLGAAGLVVLLVATVLPHALAWSYGSAAQSMFGQIFGGAAARSVSTPTGPGETERLNVLLIGVDAAPGRTETLTDSMIVVSLDPIGRTVSMVSIPRDLASVPLGNGDVFAPKINSLMSWADRHPTDYPQGGVRALEDAIGALLGIPIHYYAKVDLAGFAKMVDAVGGVDINVKKALDDPKYPGLDGKRGWSIEPGAHHFNGTDALAYARIRKSAGESDLTRAARQQEVLVALRNQAVSAGILFNLPSLLDAIGATVRTDLPIERLPQLAALAEQIGGSSTTKVVLGSPMIKSGGNTQYGSIYVPVPSRIRAMVKVVFGKPGADPTWPVPSLGASGGPGTASSPSAAAGG